jgi:formylglycine-generating enzyme
MRKLLSFLLIATIVVISACSQEMPEKSDNDIFVKGGTFKNTKSNYNGATISNFYIGKYEVTQKDRNNQ